MKCLGHRDVNCHILLLKASTSSRVRWTVFCRSLISDDLMTSICLWHQCTKRHEEESKQFRSPWREDIIPSRRQTSGSWFHESRRCVPRPPCRAGTESDRGRCPGNTAGDQWCFRHFVVNGDGLRPLRMKELIQYRAAPRMPNDIWSLLSKMSWSTVSKAADISSMPSSVTSPFSAAESASDTIFKTAVSFEW